MNNENKNCQNKSIAVNVSQNAITSRPSIKNDKRKIIIEFGEKNNKIINNKKFGNNEVKTTKYNAITLVPKNLFYQLCRASNIFFSSMHIELFIYFSKRTSINDSNFFFCFNFYYGKRCSFGLWSPFTR